MPTLSVGLLDKLFGKKVRIDLSEPAPRGRAVWVTERWLEAQTKAGRIGPIDDGQVIVHVLSLDGESTVAWSLGQQVTRAEVARFADPESGHLYLMQFFNDGKLESWFTSRAQWEEARERLAPPPDQTGKP